jgi:hypothetical protein
MPKEQCNLRRCIVPGAVYMVLCSAHCAHHARSTPCCDLQCAVLQPVTRQRATKFNPLQPANRCVATCFKSVLHPATGHVATCNTPCCNVQPVMSHPATRCAAGCNIPCCNVQHATFNMRHRQCNTTRVHRMQHATRVHRMQHATRNTPRTPCGACAQIYMYIYVVLVVCGWVCVRARVCV